MGLIVPAALWRGDGSFDVKPGFSSFQRHWCTGKNKADLEDLVVAHCKSLGGKYSPGFPNWCNSGQKSEPFYSVNIKWLERSNKCSGYSSFDVIAVENTKILSK
ncbi:MAG: hypothetical protein R8M14_07480 [Ghiorsea sp.]